MPSLLTQVMHLYVSILIKAMLETILVDTLVSSGRPTIANDLLQQSHKPHLTRQAKHIHPLGRQTVSIPSHESKNYHMVMLLSTLHQTTPINPQLKQTSIASHQPIGSLQNASPKLSRQLQSPRKRLSTPLTHPGYSLQN